MYNVIKASTVQARPKNTITVKKNARSKKALKKRKNNKSKLSDRANDQEYFSYEITNKQSNNSKTKKILSQKFQDLDSGKLFLIL
jgi:hypothetical protein